MSIVCRQSAVTLYIYRATGLSAFKISTVQKTESEARILPTHDRPATRISSCPNIQVYVCTNPPHEY